MIKCPLCGERMCLAQIEATTWWQCSDPLHRMSLTEYSNMASGSESREQIIEHMEQRQFALVAQSAQLQGS